jgi:hypothetical protein
MAMTAIAKKTRFMNRTSAACGDRLQKTAAIEIKPRYSCFGTVPTDLAGDPKERKGAFFCSKLGEKAVFRPENWAF